MTKHWQFRRTNQAIPGTPENTGLAVRKETVHYYIQKITLSSNKYTILFDSSVCWNCLVYQALKVFIIIFTLVELAVRWEWDYISFQKLSDISIHMLYKFFRIIWNFPRNAPKTIWYLEFHILIKKIKPQTKVFYNIYCDTVG